MLSAEFSVEKINTCHNPAGTSTGGQFCSTSGSRQYASGVVEEKIDDETGEYYSAVSVDKLIERGEKVDSKIQSLDKVKNGGSDWRKKEEEFDKAIAKNEAKAEKLHAEFNAMSPELQSKNAEKYGTKLDALLAETTDLHAKREAFFKNGALASDVHYGMRMAFGRQEERISWSMESRITGVQKEIAINGVDWFTTRIGDAKLGARSANVDVKYTDSGRSFATGKEIHLSATVNSSTVVHEMGHWLEHSREDVRQAAVGFLERRYSGQSEGIKRMSTLKGENHFSDKEVGFRDKFTDAYTGKVYSSPSGRIDATEIVSMGSELLFRDPVGFRRKDPEHYHFTLGLLDYVAKHKDPTVKTTGFAPFRSKRSDLAIRSEQVKAYGG